MMNQMNPGPETMNIVMPHPKKKSQIIQQQGVLDQFSFSSSSLMIGGVVVAGLSFLMSAGKGSVNTRIGQDSLSGFYYDTGALTNKI